MADNQSSAELQLIAKLKAEILSLEGQSRDIQEEMKDVVKGSVEEAQKQLELEKLSLAQQTNRLEIQKLEILEKRNSKELTKQEKEELEKITEELEKQRKTAKDQIKAQENRIKLLRKEDEHQQKIRSNVLGIVKAEEQRRVKLGEILEETKKISKEDAIATLSAKVREAGFLVLALAEDFNSVTAALNKATNTSGKFDAMLANVISSNVRFGISAENAAKSIEDLYTEFSDFSGMSQQTQQNLTEFTAKMDKAGISSQTTAKFLNVASKSMGMGAQETMKYQKELFAFARANGISTKAINDGLSSVMPRLAAFGKQGPAIFKEMAFRSKALGIEMGKLLDVTEKFTTFEGAAEAAGELNSVLGGNYIDSLELLRAASEDPVKAQDMLRDALQKTGKSFDQLSGQQRRMFAEMLGTDLDTAASFFKKTSVEAKQAAESEEAFNDAVASFVPLGEKLKNLVSAMAPAIKIFSTVLGGAVDLLASFVSNPVVSFLLSVAAGFAGLAAAAVGLMAFFGSAIGTVGLLWKALSGSKEIFTTVKNGVSNLGETVGNVFTKTVETVKNSVSSISEIISKIASGISSGFKAIMAGIGEGFKLLGNGIKSLASPQVALGVAIAGLITLVIIGLAYAFKLVLEALTPFVKTLIDGGAASLTAAIAFGLLAISMNAMAFGLLALGTVGWVGIAALMVLAPLLSVISSSFKDMGEGMKNTKEAILALTTLDVSLFNPLIEVLKTISEYMNEIGSDASKFASIFAGPMMLPLMTTAAIIPTASKITDSISSPAASSAMGVAKEQTITANLTIEVPVTLNGKELDKQIIKKVIQLNGTGDSMTQRDAGSSRGIGFSGETSNKTST